MDLNALKDLAHQYLTADLWNRLVLYFGYLSLIGQAAPLLLAWGIPAAVRAADAVAQTLLASPARPLVIWMTPKLIKFLDDLADALHKVVTSFKDELEADLKRAAETPSESPAAPVAPSKPGDPGASGGA